MPLREPSLTGRCHQHVVALLMVGKLRPIDQRRLRVGALQLDGAVDETFDRIGDIVRLIEHVRRLQRADAAPSGVNQVRITSR
jgi:hypothetical protein